MLQAVNFVLWFLIAYFKIYGGETILVYLQFALMVWVGLLGGGSYVNTLY